MLDNGDEVLVPAPDYPLWTASTSLAGGRPVHYLCDESDGWQPDLDDLRSKITAAHQGDRRHQPEQPDRRGLLAEHARGDRRPRPRARAGRDGRRDLRQDPLRRRRARAVRRGRARRLHPDLQRAVEGLPGRRIPVRLDDGQRAQAARAQLPRGHHDPGQHAAVRERPGPARGAGRARRPAEHQGPDPARRPAARAARRRGQALHAIPGVTCVVPKGALYVFPRLDPELYPIADDQRFVLELLRAQHVLVVQGTGFNWPRPTTCASSRCRAPTTCSTPIGRLGDFLSTYRGDL